jgi:hypothetical protein
MHLLDHESLTELIFLLSCQAMDADDVELVVAQVNLALDDPETYIAENGDDEMAAYLFESDPGEVSKWALQIGLDNYLVVSDKMDELHGQIEEMFAEGDSPLPDFPFDHNFTFDQYINWLNKELAMRGPREHGGYQLIFFGDSYGDDLIADVVYHDDVPRIIELCSLGELKCGLVLV